MNATDTLRLSILAILSVSAANTHAADPTPPPAADTDTTLDTIIVTGVTSQRTLLNSSVDVTPINPTQIEQKAPRSTADVLQLIPGVFVESTAGPVSNNYSVRGLPGGLQQRRT